MSDEMTNPVGKKVALIGGTGFVGSYLIDALVANGDTPRALVRPNSEGRIQHADRCEIVPGDANNVDAIERTLAGCDAVIYNIGLLREFPRRGITFEDMHFKAVERVIDKARALGVRRFILMSANGVKADGTTYQRTKFLGEDALRRSGLAWTIFRPSVIFGDPRGRMEFASQLRKEIIDMPIPAPLFYSGLVPKDPGSFKLAPVAVEDVASAFVGSLDQDWTIEQTLPLCGPDDLSWKEILTTIAATIGKKKMMVPAPVFGVKGVATLFDRQSWFPITRDQIAMLLEGNVCEASDTFERLGITPKHFAPETLGYLI